jgi:glycosyltransferase involved in cell wall biosynthesis
VSGTLWVGGRQNDAGLRRNFWPEIFHGSWQNSRLKSAWMAFVLSRFHRSGLAASVGAWVTVSEFLRGKFIQAGLAPEHVHALRPFWLMHPQPPAVPERDYYLFIGRLIEEKGVRVLLKAWDIVRRDGGPRGPRLVIAGRGPLEAEARAAAVSNPLIECAGFVTDERKSELIAGCRAMLAPSVWWEALGAVTYEAYDYAKPMLASRAGGLTETVQPGVTGDLHEPGDAVGLASQVLSLDADASRRASLGRAGRAWLVDHASPVRWKEQLFQIISRTLNSGQ